MNRTIVIAEAGVNHNGNLNIAKKLIENAAISGADYVKFQTFKTEFVVSANAPKAAYQEKNMPESTGSQFEMLKKLEIPADWYPELINCCAENQIRFLSTGFDEISIDFLSTFDPDLYKIPSGEITNKPYLKHIAKKKKPLYISTGMANLNEIKAAIEIILEEGISKESLTVLHCNTEYPTPMEDVNLLAMLHIQKELGVKVGYSDHTLGIEVPIAAVALGAAVIEKHFTLSRNFQGPDHSASLEPQEFTLMVKAIRNIELAISGNGMKQPSPSEQKNLHIARRSIHYRQDMKMGKPIMPEDLIALRPGIGISPMDIDQLFGKILTKDVMAGQIASYSDFKK